MRKRPAQPSLVAASSRSAGARARAAATTTTTPSSSDATDATQVDDDGDDSDDDRRARRDDLADLLERQKDAVIKVTYRARRRRVHDRPGRHEQARRSRAATRRSIVDRRRARSTAATSTRARRASTFPKASSSLVNLGLSFYDVVAQGLADASGQRARRSRRRRTRSRAATATCAEADVERRSCSGLAEQRSATSSFRSTSARVCVDNETGYLLEFATDERRRPTTSIAIEVDEPIGRGLRAAGRTVRGDAPTEPDADRLTPPSDDPASVADVPEAQAARRRELPGDGAIARRDDAEHLARPALARRRPRRACRRSTRTICQQNAAGADLVAQHAVAFVDPRRLLNTVRIVVEPSGPLRQNDAKSCSPTNGSAASHSARRSSGSGIHHVNRSRNGSGTGRLTIVYRYRRHVRRVPRVERRRRRARTTARRSRARAST